MKILLDLGDMDNVADDEEVLAVVRNVLAGSHDLDSGEVLYIGSVDAAIVDSAAMTVPKRSFLAWLKRQATRNDPVGDLARDAKDDTSAPRGRATKAIWLQFLKSAGASDGAISAFRKGWDEFADELAGM